MQETRSRSLKLISRVAGTADDKHKASARTLLSAAGIEIDGDHPWDVHVHNEALYRRVLAQGSLGLGESYMEGWWDCERIDEFVCRLVRAQLDHKVRINWWLALNAVKARLFNLQSRARAHRNVTRHYDLGNDLFSGMLDNRMIYSCAYWRNAASLDEAQEAKLDLICRKLSLQPGMRILDVGCGWGGFAQFAAERCDVQVVGITVSPEQATLASERCSGLPVEIRLQDYRDLDEKFDHIISVGAFEHVGYKNYRRFAEIIHRCLKPEGLFLLHTIGGNRSVKSTDAWIGAYIFPDSMLPSIAQIGRAIEGLFVLEDWHVLSRHYDLTLMAWHQNFQRNWESIRTRYDATFKRMWEFYLLSCAGAFRARANQLWQLVLSRNGIPGGYAVVR